MIFAVLDIHLSWSPRHPSVENQRHIHRVKAGDDPSISRLHGTLQMDTPIGAF
jgi:hypothetical protein